MAIPRRFADHIYREVLDGHVIRDSKMTVDSTRADCVRLINKHRNNITALIEDILRIQYRLKQFLPIMNGEIDMRELILGEAFQELLARNNPQKVFAHIKAEAPGNDLLFMVAEELGMGIAAVLEHAIKRAATKAECEPQITELFNSSAKIISVEIEEEGQMSIAERDRQRAAQGVAN